MSPYISIIIPTYNREKTIDSCLKSIQIQTFQDYEIIIVDGASTDNTLSTIEKFRSYFNNKLKVVSELDKGIYDAMNKGVERSTGKWLYFLGSDDTLYNAKVLENIFNVIYTNKEDYDIIYGNVQLQPENKLYGEEYSLSIISNRRNICHQAIFYKRKIFVEVGIYNQEYRVAADWDFNLRVFLNKNFKKHYIDIPVANYSNEGFSSTNSDTKFYNDYDKLILTYGYQTLPLKLLKFYSASNWLFIKMVLKRIFRK